MKKMILSAFLIILSLQTKSLAADEKKEKGGKAETTIKATVILDKNASTIETATDEEDHEPPGSPPLQTDDTGTPGYKGIEVNFINECDKSKIMKGCEFVIDANFGIGDRWQLKVERPYEFEKHEGQPSQQHIGATEVGVKYRFLERSTWSMAIYPNYTFNDATPPKMDNGEREEKEGASLYIPLIVSKRMGEFTVVTNTGYKKSFKSSDLNSWAGGIAVSHKVGENATGMAEVYTERDKLMQNLRTNVRIGYVKVVFPNERSKFETAVFTSVGRSIGFTEDGHPHMTFQVGLKVVKKPAH